MEHVQSFWDSLERQWPIIYEAIVEGNEADQRRVLDLLHFFAGPHKLDFEFTLGEVNRVTFEEAKKTVELYISPKLLKENVPIMEAFYAARRPLPNLKVLKYRSYNAKDPLIATVEYPDYTYQYTDFGCQAYTAVGDDKKQIVNLVIYVRKEAAQKLLKQKEVTFVSPDGTETKMLKWLPADVNVVDVLLVNIIGEYNLIHRTGYIEFMPEGDPLIANGSIFTELADMRTAYTNLDKFIKQPQCSVCGRLSYQCEISSCGRCRKTKYCSKTCQIVDFPTHKTLCTK